MEQNKKCKTNPKNTPEDCTMHNHTHNHSHCACHSHDEEEKETPLFKIVLSGVFLIFALILEHIKPSAFISNVKNIDLYAQYAFIAVSLIGYLLAGRDVVKSAILNLFSGKLFDEQFLMTVASLGAVCIGSLPEAVAIMFFYQLGERFEDYATEKSEKSIESLLKIRPDSAVVLRDGKEEKVKAEEVLPGETIIVKPGERIPCDGIILLGNSFVDNSAITGESVPVEALQGSEVFSGAINKSTLLKIKTTKLALDSAASRIIKLVEFSSEKKTRAERFITRFSRIYTPIVCLLALCVAVIPPLVTLLLNGDKTWHTWIYRAISFLVVSCPCAIVISVPLTFFGGLGSLSRNGILVKGSAALEALSKAKVAVFDKTGTLTKGIFEVSEVVPYDKNISQEELLAIASHAEKESTHPVAKSLFMAHTKNQKEKDCCKKQILSEVHELSGHGIKAILNQKEVLAGNAKLMIKNDVIGFNLKEEENTSLKKAGTIVYIAQEKKYLGYIVISDRIKEDAVLGIEKLKKAGIKKIVLLTGDNERAAKKIADEIGITDVFSDLLPEDKVSKIEELLEKEKTTGGKVIFSGDGINDAPVLARSDVGIAMGALGSDAALESSDVVIMTDEILKIADSIKISRRTLNIVYQNIIFSLGIKVLIMILSAMGLTSMWISVLGDVGVLFLVVLNSMRALKKSI